MVVARNEGVGMLFIHALSENAAMLKIARKAGATVVRSGSESEAHLELPRATFDSRMSEIALEHFAQVDFQLKTRAKQFWAFLAELQEIAAAVRAAELAARHGRATKCAQPSASTAASGGRRRR